MPTLKRACGDAGERLAEGFLRARGFRIVARQVIVGRHGEIDLIAIQGDVLVFVEVKTRRSDAFGSPEEAVTASKLRRLSAAIETYRREKRLEHRPYRLDVVAVDLSGPMPEVRHVRAVGGV